MHDQGFRRRDVLCVSTAAVAGALLAPLAVAASPPRKLFAGTPLAGNPLADRFETLPADLRLPTAALQTPAGERPLSSLRGAATLVTIWAEFCAPCLMEMPDLARLGDRFHASGFDVIALHAGGTLEAAKAKLAAIGTPTIPAWNDPHGAVVTPIATPPHAKGFTLPCNLLVDRHGRVRGRAFGAQSLTNMGSRDRALTPQDKQRLIHARSSWALPAADRFAQALGSGLLDRI